MTSPHPVRLVVNDDLERSRLTVLFRLILAIPHLVWVVLWTIAAVLAAVVNWFATLVAGRSPQSLHAFLATYLRYLTQLLAYLTLAANPYPSFTGGEGYPVDLEIDDPAPQRRLLTLVRIVLAVPALAFAGAFVAVLPRDTSSANGIVWGVAVLAWFAVLAIRRMPLGFRDLIAYGLRYYAQTLAYLFVLTERYPDVEPAGRPPPGRVHPVALAVDDDLRRSRLTSFFRLLLALPHLVWLALWTIVAWFALIASWFVALFSIDERDLRYGRPPASLHRFLSAYVRYVFHVQAFVTLAANPFPGFTGTAGTYPVDPQLPGREPQNRLVTLFRFPLAFPALAVSSSLYALAVLAAFFGWFVAVLFGRMPGSLRAAQAYVLRYGAQTTAYFWLLTDRYPFSGPGRGEPEREPPAERVETPVPA